MKRARLATRIERALEAKRESKYVDFKESFDTTQPGEWCEVIKDLVAMANSGGGVILIGLRNNGEPSGWNPAPLLRVDPAEITDKLARYTGEQFADFELREVRKGRTRLAAIEVRSAAIPLVFIQPGTYDVGGGKQKTAFSRGTVYFRHGAKSEPAVSKDLRDFLDRELDRIRRSWLGNIRKVAEAPPGSLISVVPPGVAPSSTQRVPVRIVTDPKAAGYAPIQYDVTHPYRQKEVIALVNGRLGEGKRINSFDVQCVRRVHKIDQERPEFCYKPKFSTAQFSDAFVDWLVEQHEKDHEFFEKVRSVYRG